MNLRVILSSEVKRLKSRSRRETESDMGVRRGRPWRELLGIDPKPGDLSMARLKLE